MIFLDADLCDIRSILRAGKADPVRIRHRTGKTKEENEKQQDRNGVFLMPELYRKSRIGSTWHNVTKEPTLIAFYL